MSEYLSDDFEFYEHLTSPGSDPVPDTRVCFVPFSEGRLAGFLIPAADC